MDKNTSTYKYLPVSLTEELILNYAALPPQFEGWRRYRVEFGGCNECCIKETPIYLPMCADSYILDLLFDFWQEEDAKKKKRLIGKILNELARGLT